jgi:hypothetical protein
VALREELAVGADYGLTVLNGAPAAAVQLATLILSRTDKVYWPNTASRRRP